MKHNGTSSSSEFQKFAQCIQVALLTNLALYPWSVNSTKSKKSNLNRRLNCIQHKTAYSFPKGPVNFKILRRTDCIEGLWAAIVDLPSTGEDQGAAAYQNAAPPMLLQQISRTTTRVVRHSTQFHFSVKWRLPGFYVRKCPCLSPCLARFKEFIGS